ncbi:MAG: hypothetical protein LC734_09530 [Acidobacteria bacterium]|nr:hypothetical protein [Acidobacteriota bacterium]
MMRVVSLLFIFIFAALFGCSGEGKPATPVETFKTYARALKQKDTAAMKLLLSSETMKMHEQEAKSQNVLIDEIVGRETLFSGDQRKIEFRNESIDGERATLEVKNSFGTWETVPFVFEDDQWKIDKKQFAERLLQDIEQQNQQLRQQIDEGRSPAP